MSDTPQNLHQQAITAALSSNWQEAIRLNNQIIEAEPENVDALNRAARAYFETGDLIKSKHYFNLSLKIDPYNPIASKFIKRIDSFKKQGGKKALNINHNHITPDLFIEEAGKTKLVGLMKVAEPHKLSLLSAGDEVKLITKNRGITVTDLNGEYLGVMPDDMSHILTRLIKGGNRYQAYIKSIKTNGLTLLVREVFRSSRFKNQPSFLDNSSPLTYSSDHITIFDNEEESPSEEEELTEIV
ncbi:tetratricopeptide repeat protein [Candidatus Daviesbacteria bacterium]|nr:tetratricopeptide repeat protein [Candidatus Daviesbacteria bacterium]